MNLLRSGFNAVRRSSPFSGAGLFGRKSRAPNGPSPSTTAGQPTGLLLLLTKAS